MLLGELVFISVSECPWWSHQLLFFFKKVKKGVLYRLKTGPLLQKGCVYQCVCYMYFRSKKWSSVLLRQRRITYASGYGVRVRHTRKVCVCVCLLLG